MAVRNAANKRMQSRGKASCSRQEPDGRMPSKVWARPFRGTKTALTDSHKALEEDLENEGRLARDGPATATANPLPVLMFPTITWTENIKTTWVPATLLVRTYQGVNCRAR